jgi:hypothetical protein
MNHLATMIAIFRQHSLACAYRRKFPNAQPVAVKLTKRRRVQSPAQRSDLKSSLEFCLLSLTVEPSEAFRLVVLPLQDFSQRFPRQIPGKHMRGKFPAATLLLVYFTMRPARRFLNYHRGEQLGK